MTRGGAFRRDGFVLIATLWLLVALATLASIYTLYATRVAAGSHVGDERLQSEEAIRSAVELAAWRLLAAPDKARPTRGAFETRLGGATVSTRFVAENARIDLNAAPKELLAGLFATVGVKPEAAGALAERIVAWRTKVKADATNAEPDAYRAAGLAYAPRQAPFVSALELALVLGMQPATMERILDDVTIYGGSAQIEARDATAEVLSALPQMTPELLQQALARRAAEPENGRALLDALGAARDGATIEAGKAYRAYVSVVTARGRGVRAEVVFVVDADGEEPYDILLWRDDFDGPLTPG